MLLPGYFVQLRIAKVKFLVQCQEISTSVVILSAKVLP